MVGQMGFQSHSFYLVLGVTSKGSVGDGDTTELDPDWAETNPSNQPNQPDTGLQTKLSIRKLPEDGPELPPHHSPA